MTGLSIRHDLPADILGRPAGRLHEVLDGPTLVHLQGRKKPPLFLSVLMHGNEDTGWRVLQNVLHEHGKTLPRSLSIFIGNVKAARYGKRRLEKQPDFNRIWAGGDSPEHATVKEVLRTMRRRGVFASIDIHNNTGINPHYACVNRLLPPYLNLARKFSRMVIYFTRPSGVQSLAFARFCPAVTLECGQPGDEIGIQLATKFVNEVMNMDAVPETPVKDSDIDLYHTVAVAKVPLKTTFSFDNKPADIRFIRGIEQLNFEEIPAGTALAELKGSDIPLDVMDEDGNPVAHQYFEAVDNRLLTRTPLMPSMLTTNERIVRQDCLCYLMERYKLASGEKPLPEETVWN